MDRRDFLLGAGGAGLLPAFLGTFKAQPAGAAAGGAGVETESRRALKELIETLEAVDTRYLGAEFGITRPTDVADGHRYLMHVLQTGLRLHLESDPELPRFQRIVSPTQKSLGDNPDGIYYEAAIRGDRSYRVRGKMNGAVYASLTVEGGGGAGGAYPTGVAATINSDEFEVDAEGRFELRLGPEAPARNGLRLPPNARSLTTRHYFEEPRPVAGDPLRHVDLVIEPTQDPGPPPTANDARIAAGVRRVIAYIKGLTLGMGRPGERPLPAWVSTTPNHFNAPAKPGRLAFAAVDIAYSMAPYRLGPDEALLLTGTFPRCRFANVVLWNRFLQTYDYLHRPISRNRAQTRLEADGSYRFVVAHRDPGAPNWLDTEGRESGIIYWRFMLPEGAIQTPLAKLVKWSEVARR